MAYVYIHTRLDTNKVFYVGMSIESNYKRAYLRAKRTKFWNNIVSKTKYRVDIIYDGLTVEEAKLKEIELIKKYGRRDLGKGDLTNLTDGGDGVLGCKISEETRYKISKTLISKNIKTTPKLNSNEVKDICDKICKGMRCRDIQKIYPIVSKNMFQQIYSKSTWKEITSKYIFPEIKRKYFFSKKTRQKISNKLLGKFYGKTIKIKCLNDKKEFNSVKEASEYYSLSKGQIYHILSSKRTNLYKTSISLNFIKI